MKSYKDTHKFPLRLCDGSHFIFDANNHRVAQFEPQFDINGNFKEGYCEFIKDCIDKINGKDVSLEVQFEKENNQIFIINQKEPIIIIRGWGYLTGTGGGLGLSHEIAAKIQDEFAEFLLEKLNHKPIKTKEDLFKEIPFLDIDKNGDYYNILKTKVLEAMEEHLVIQLSGLVNDLKGINPEYHLEYIEEQISILKHGI